MNSVFTVEELFSGKVLIVPDYQRGFAWESKQLNDFLDDLEYLSDGRHHYTGTVVLHQQSATVRDEEGRSNKVYHVVDGQQRLTTIVILLECIQAKIHKSNATLAAGIRKTYIEFRDLNQQPAYKLRLNSDCQDFFVRNILSNPTGPQGPTIASHKRMKEAKAEFSRYLEEQSTNRGTDFPAWLLSFYEKVVLQLKVSQYIVEQSSEVGVIFEVMNNRGKPLSELEKVKNYLLYLCSKLDLDQDHDLEDRINGTWTEIFQKLMANGLNSSADENRLLRAHWLMVYDPNPRVFSGSDSIKQEYSLKRFSGEHTKLLNALTKYTSSLKDCVGPFCEAFSPAHSDSFSIFDLKERQIIRVAAEKLRRIGVVAPFLPVLVACRLRFAGDSAKYRSILNACEVFAFRVYKVKDKRSDAGQAGLYKLGHQVYKHEVSFHEAILQIKKLTLQFCSNQELADDCALDDHENDWYSWGALKYVLYEYEEHLAGKHGVKVSWDVFDTGDAQRTIEHILPQAPNDGCWRQVFDRHRRKKFTHDISNLCLTEDNSAYGNKCFVEKVGKPGIGRCYANSNLFQERELAQFEKWTEDSLNARRAKFIAWYLQRWHLDDSDITDNLSSIDADGQIANEEASF